MSSRGDAIVPQLVVNAAVRATAANFVQSLFTPDAVTWSEWVSEQLHSRLDSAIDIPMLLDLFRDALEEWSDCAEILEKTVQDLKAGIAGMMIG